MPELLNPAPVAHLRHLLRAHSPLVHCMTNDVVQTFTANVLLAVGASPAMVIDPREAAQFAAIADALLINVGTLTADRAVAMRAAVEQARRADKPWTLDPVAVGALTVRTAFCRELLALHPAAIRGNASEILALAGMSGGGRGVDTTDTAAAAPTGRPGWMRTPCAGAIRPTRSLPPTLFSAAVGSLSPTPRCCSGGSRTRRGSRWPSGALTGIPPMVTRWPNRRRSLGNYCVYRLVSQQ